MNNEEFLRRVSESNNGRYEVLSEFVNWRSKIKVVCTICGKEGNPRVDKLLKGRSCPKCNSLSYSKKYTKTTAQYKLDVNEKGLGDYELISEYSGVNSPISILHKTCGNPFPTTPFQFNRGRRCPFCKESKGEVFVSKFLEKNGIPYTREATNKAIPKLPHRMSYDFLLHENRVLIEYQGIQHYKPVDVFGGQESYERQQENDAVKRKFAKDNGYHLIEVPYTENTFDKVSKFLQDNINI